MTDTINYNRNIRLRVNHVNTQREGWRLAETTVEIEFDPRDLGMDAARALRNNLEALHQIGTAEAQRRNAADG